MEKLIKIQTEMNVKKNLYNKFGNYHYRNAESILFAVKPFLKDLKCSLIVNDEIVLIGERYYIKATATLTDKESGEEVSTSAYARESALKKGMDESQITGSASSYARKYALNGLFLLDDVKDSDSIEKDDTEKEKKSPNYKQVKIYEIINGTPIKNSQIAGFIKATFNKEIKPNDLTNDQFQAFTDLLYRKIDKLMQEKLDNETQS